MSTPKKTLPRAESKFSASNGSGRTDPLSEVQQMRDRLAKIRDAIEKIVVVRGEDSGVILLSNESCSEWNERLQAHIYKHEHFSPLGDALIALHRMTDLPKDQTAELKT